MEVITSGSFFGSEGASGSARSVVASNLLYVVAHRDGAALPSTFIQQGH